MTRNTEIAAEGAEIRAAKCISRKNMGRLHPRIDKLSSENSGGLEPNSKMFRLENLKITVFQNFFLVLPYIEAVGQILSFLKKEGVSCRRQFWIFLEIKIRM